VGGGFMRRRRMKHTQKVKYYIRYADDFVILHEDKSYLEEMTPHIDAFLSERLKLSLHPDKVYIKTFASGVDFLGWIHFPHHRVLRTATKKRMFRNLNNKKGNPDKYKATLQSYLGMVSHGNCYKIREKISQITAQ